TPHYSFSTKVSLSLPMKVCVLACPSCFFFSSRRRHTRCGRDWSSDVCLPIFAAVIATTVVKWLEGVGAPAASSPLLYTNLRSEERRVGKECRSRWSPYH